MSEEPKDYEYAICPYCKKVADCEHLFVVFDAYDGSVVGGYLFDKMEPLLEKVREFFKDHLARCGVRKDSMEPLDYSVIELWEEMFEGISYYQKNNEKYDMSLVISDRSAISVILCLLPMDAVKAYEPAGMHLGLTYSYYTDENHEENYEAILNSTIYTYLNLDVKL